MPEYQIIASYDFDISVIRKLCYVLYYVSKLVKHVYGKIYIYSYTLKDALNVLITPSIFPK